MRNSFSLCMIITVLVSSWWGFCKAEEPTPPGKPQDTPAAPGVAYTNSMSVLDDKRKLAIGDRVSFHVVEDHRPPVSLVVTDSGEIEAPLIGRVMALNKTCKQLAYDLKVPLEKEYFYTATVIVGLDYASSKSRGRVYVIGNVRSGGPMEIPADENFTVSRAILRAGGFDQYANKHKVKLIRKKADSPSETETIIMDVGDIIDHGRADRDMVLLPDDMIIVTRNLINY
jgi:polysaccharide export outer membrane protein